MGRQLSIGIAAVVIPAIIVMSITAGTLFWHGASGNWQDGSFPGQEADIPKLLDGLAGGCRGAHFNAVVTFSGSASRSEWRLLFLAPGCELPPDCDGCHKKRKGEYLHHIAAPFPAASSTHRDALELRPECASPQVNYCERRA
jgi:hypothetical protein